MRHNTRPPASEMRLQQSLPRFTSLQQRHEGMRELFAGQDVPQRAQYVRSVSCAALIAGQRAGGTCPLPAENIASAGQSRRASGRAEPRGDSGLNPGWLAGTHPVGGGRQTAHRNGGRGARPASLHGQPQASARHQRLPRACMHPAGAPPAPAGRRQTMHPIRPATPVRRPRRSLRAASAHATPWACCEGCLRTRGDSLGGLQSTSKKSRPADGAGAAVWKMLPLIGRRPTSDGEHILDTPTHARAVASAAAAAAAAALLLGSQRIQRGDVTQHVFDVLRHLRSDAACSQPEAMRPALHTHACGGCARLGVPARPASPPAAHRCPPALPPASGRRPGCGLRSDRRPNSTPVCGSFQDGSRAVGGCCGACLRPAWWVLTSPARDIEHAAPISHSLTRSSSVRRPSRPRQPGG